MVAHKGLPVGSWLRQMGHEGHCQLCLQEEESLKHCLWSCLQAQAVWKGAMGILARAAPELGPVTWGAFCWCSTEAGHHLAYEFSPRDPVFLITQATWAHVDFPWHLTETDAGAMTRHPVWEIVGSIVGWHIWTSRCAQTLGDQISSTTQTLADIWSTIIHTLKGHWDQIQGDSKTG